MNASGIGVRRKTNHKGIQMKVLLPEDVPLLNIEGTSKEAAPKEIQSGSEDSYSDILPTKRMELFVNSNLRG